jgi:hypothetical protein
MLVRAGMHLCAALRNSLWSSLDQTDDMTSVGRESIACGARLHVKKEVSDGHPITAIDVLVRQATRHLKRRCHAACTGT